MLSFLTTLTTAAGKLYSSFYQNKLLCPHNDIFAIDMILKNNILAGCVKVYLHSLYV